MNTILYFKSTFRQLRSNNANDLIANNIMY